MSQFETLSVESSAVKLVGYRDGGEKQPDELLVWFQNGAPYIYRDREPNPESGVYSVYVDIIRAKGSGESIGSLIHNRLRGRYPSERVSEKQVDIQLAVD